MTGFANSKGGRDGARLQDPLDVLQVALGAVPSTAPWLDAAKAAAARAAGLPKAGGLIGSTYARFMADNAPRFLGEAQRRLGLEPRIAPGGGQRPAMPVTASVQRPAVRESTASGHALSARSAPAAQAGGPNPQDPNSDVAQLAALKAHLSDPEVEGFRDYVYLDSRKIPTTGVGHKVRPEDNLKVGQKVDSKVLDRFFEEDASGALKAARAQAAEAGIDDPEFITALGSVNFQLGSGWNTGKNGHKKTWALIKQGDYAAAADEVARSDWNKQTPKRVAQFQKALLALAAKRGG